MKELVELVTEVKKSQGRDEMSQGRDEMKQSIYHYHDQLRAQCPICQQITMFRGVQMEDHGTAGVVTTCKHFDGLVMNGREGFVYYAEREK